MKNLTRAEAIDALRSKLVGLTDDGHSTCWAASRLQVFCGGEIVPPTRDG